MNSEKYTVIGLTNEQVAGGGLSFIGDIIRDSFLQTSQWATQNKHLRPTEHWAKILFKDPFVQTEDIGEQYEGVADQLLFANTEAMSLINAAGVNVSIVGSNADAPRHHGTMISMPIWR